MDDEEYFKCIQKLKAGLPELKKRGPTKMELPGGGYVVIDYESSKKMLEDMEKIYFMKKSIQKEIPF